MSAPDHDRWADSAAAYLLGALPADEVEGFERHLARCPACLEEVDALTPAAHALPSSVQPLAPPPELKARIMAEVEREAALLAAAGPEADRPPAPQPARRRRRWTLPMPRLATAATAAALLIAGAAIGAGVSRLGDSSDPHTVTAAVDAKRAPRAGASVEVSGDGATLVARGLPAPPSGRVYQVWIKRPGQAPQPTSVLFTPSREGAATATVPGPLEEVEQVLVTDEPAGGSPSPTRQPLVIAEMS
jgi:anti-sigma-K factor RskA